MIDWCQVLQPARLEDLTIQALARCIIMPILDKMPTLTETQTEDMTEVPNPFARHIENTRHRLQRCVSRELHDKLAAEMIETLVKLSRDPKHFAMVDDRCPRSYKKIMILGRVIETIFTKHLTRLTVDIRELYMKYSDMFIAPICLNPHLLRNLLRFDLFIDMNNSTVSQHFLKSIILVFKELRNLLHVSLHGSLCTPEVLQSLADNCKDIEKLQLSSTYFITTTLKTMSHLTRLSKLRCFMCKYIYFPYKDFTKELLIACKDIEYIDIKPAYSDYYEYPIEDYISEAVRDIIMSDNNTEKKLKLKYYRVGDETKPENMALIIETCPLMAEIMFSCSGFDIRLEDFFRMFLNLTRLKLDFFFINSHKILDMLFIKGGNLVELHLKSVYEIDLNALGKISEMCPNLECLYMHCCGFISSQHSSTLLDIDILDNPPFVNLKRLSMSGCSIPFEDHCKTIVPLIYFLLVNSPNVEYVTFGSLFGVDIMKDIITKVLDKNLLIHLKEFYSVTPCYELSEISREHLIRNNVNPTGVIEVKTGMNDFEVTNILQKQAFI